MKKSYKENNNVAELARNLGFSSDGTQYHHLLILLNYVSLREALTLVLNSEVS
jgi:hypothetical protein